jgi:hypothetical protein
MNDRVIRMTDLCQLEEINVIAAPHLGLKKFSRYPVLLASFVTPY